MHPHYNYISDKVISQNYGINYTNSTMPPPSYPQPMSRMVQSTVQPAPTVTEPSQPSISGTNAGANIFLNQNIQVSNVSFLNNKYTQAKNVYNQPSTSGSSSSSSSSSTTSSSSPSSSSSSSSTPSPSSNLSSSPAGMNVQNRIRLCDNDSTLIAQLMENRRIYNVVYNFLLYLDLKNIVETQMYIHFFGIQTKIHQDLKDTLEQVNYALRNEIIDTISVPVTKLSETGKQYFFASFYVLCNQAIPTFKKAAFEPQFDLFKQIFKESIKMAINRQSYLHKQNQQHQLQQQQQQQQQFQRASIIQRQYGFQSPQYQREDCQQCVQSQQNSFNQETLQQQKQQQVVNQQIQQNLQSQQQIPQQTQNLLHQFRKQPIFPQKAPQQLVQTQQIPVQNVQQQVLRQSIQTQQVPVQQNRQPIQIQQIPRQNIQQQQPQQQQIKQPIQSQQALIQNTRQHQMPSHQAQVHIQTQQLTYQQQSLQHENAPQQLQPQQIQVQGLQKQQKQQEICQFGQSQPLQPQNTIRSNEYRIEKVSNENPILTGLLQKTPSQMQENQVQQTNNQQQFPQLAVQTHIQADPFGIPSPVTPENPFSFEMIRQMEETPVSCILTPTQSPDLLKEDPFVPVMPQKKIKTNIIAADRSKLAKWQYKPKAWPNKRPATRKIKRTPKKKLCLTPKQAVDISKKTASFRIAQTTCIPQDGRTTPEINIRLESASTTQEKAMKSPTPKQTEKVPENAATLEANSEILLPSMPTIDENYTNLDGTEQVSKQCEKSTESTAQPENSEANTSKKSNEPKTGAPTTNTDNNESPSQTNKDNEKVMEDESAASSQPIKKENKSPNTSGLNMIMNVYSLVTDDENDDDDDCLIIDEKQSASNDKKPVKQEPETQGYTVSLNFD